MEQVLFELEVKLRRFTQHAKIIMWLSIVSIINPLLYLIALLWFLVYNNRLSKFKYIESLRGVFDSLNDKTTKELKFIQNQNESLEQCVASLLLAHKSLVIVLIVIGLIIAAVISVIGISYL